MAVGLATLAGYVDAAGLMMTQGLFLSFMSGNSTRMSVALAESNFQFFWTVLGVIVLFVVGVMAGTLVSRLTGKRRKTYVLVLVLILLTLAATCHSFHHTIWCAALLALAMGAENAVFQRNGEVSIGLTYMTGTLVRLGQQFASMILGGSRRTWLRFAFHWLGLASGAVVGAWTYGSLERFAFWPPVGLSLILLYGSTLLHDPKD